MISLKKSTILLIVGGLLFVVGGLLLAGTSHPAFIHVSQQGTMSSQMIPDVDTRNRVAHIKGEDIVSLRFYGMDMGAFENDAVEIHDRRLVAIFLQALQQASESNSLDIGNRVDVMEILLKRHGQQPVEQIFNFNALSMPDAYGPKFWQALRALTNFQVARTHILGTAKWNATTAIEVGNVKIIGKQPVQHFLNELKDVNSNAFAYSEKYTLRFYGPRLIRSNGTVVNLHFVVAQTQQISAGKTTDSLPPLLWRTFQQAKYTVNNHSVRSSQ